MHKKSVLECTQISNCMAYACVSVSVMVGLVAPQNFLPSYRIPDFIDLFYPPFEYDKC